MSDLASRLTHAGIVLVPFRQGGEAMTLEWDPEITGPILGDETLVVLPDMHLSNGDGGDVFSVDPHALPRLERLLRTLVAEKAASPGLRVVHLGDLYDVWRTYPEFRGADPPDVGYDRILQVYRRALGLLIEGLDARVCIGNHDAVLARFPPSWARTADNTPTGQLAYCHLFGGGSVIALHGHQDKAVGEAMADQGGHGMVQFMTLAARLSAPASQLLQERLDLAAEFFSDRDLALLQGHWGLVPPPPDIVGFTSNTWCDRNGRTRLGKLIAAHPAAADIRLVLVGHTHCAGISFAEIGSRTVPLVDCGSWIQGKSQIAIAEEGRLAIYTVG